MAGDIVVQAHGTHVAGFSVLHHTHHTIAGELLKSSEFASMTPWLAGTGIAAHDSTSKAGHCRRFRWSGPCDVPPGFADIAGQRQPRTSGTQPLAVGTVIFVSVFFGFWGIGRYERREVTQGGQAPIVVQRHDCIPSSRHEATHTR